MELNLFSIFIIIIFTIIFITLLFIFIFKNKKCFKGYGCENKNCGFDKCGNINGCGFCLDGQICIDGNCTINKKYICKDFKCILDNYGIYDKIDDCEKNCIKPIDDPLLEIKKDIVYNNYHSDKTQMLDIYIPKNPNGKGIVLVHGGGLVKGSKSSEREVSITLDFISKGYYVFSINYELGFNSYPESMKNLLDAINYIKLNYKDLKLSIIGLSAGSTLVLTTVLKNNLSNTFDNVISMYAITSPLDRTYINTTEKHKSGEFRSGHMPEVLGTSRCISCKSKVPNTKDTRYCQDTDTHKQSFHCVANIWKDISPVENITKDTKISNIILVHGEKDTIVNPEQPKIFKDKIKEILPSSYNNVNIIMVPEGQHGFDFSKNRDSTPLYTDSKYLFNKILDFMK